MPSLSPQSVTLPPLVVIFLPLAIPTLLAALSNTWPVADVVVMLPLRVMDEVDVRLTTPVAAMPLAFTVKACALVKPKLLMLLA